MDEASRSLFQEAANQMSVKEHRAEIDAIDGELLRLLNQRALLAIKVGESKRLAGLSLCDRQREREVVERACRANRGPLDVRAVMRLFRCIIRESKLVEEGAAARSNSRQKVSL